MRPERALPPDAPDGAIDVVRGGIRVIRPYPRQNSAQAQRNVGLQRQWQMLLYLQTWRTIPEIAEHFGVHIRTVYRDIRTLESVPFPMRRHDTTGRWKINCRVSLVWDE